MLVLDRVLRKALVDETWDYCVRRRRSRRSLCFAEFITHLTDADDIAASCEPADCMFQAAAGCEVGLEINAAPCV